jgi:uncharacterized protein YktB (UPF0637 family)
MTSFAVGEVEQLAAQVAAKVLAEIEPKLVDFGTKLVDEVVAKVEALIESKLGSL